MVSLTLVPMLATATDSINSGLTAACNNACNTGTSVNSLFSNVAKTLIYIIGAVSVIMIIIGGLNYVTSNGDSKKTAAAKDTILYAAVGVVVAISAYAIVKFVTSNIK